MSQLGHDGIDRLLVDGVFGGCGVGNVLYLPVVGRVALGKHVGEVLRLGIAAQELGGGVEICFDGVVDVGLVGQVVVVAAEECGLVVDFIPFETPSAEP